jgi:hypothetical protein
MTVKKCFSVEVSKDELSLTLNIPQFTTFWPLYLSDKTLNRIEGEYPWLFNRVIAEYGYLSKGEFLTYDVPLDLQKKHPRIGNPYNFHTSIWGLYVKNILYRYLVEEIFPSVDCQVGSEGDIRDGLINSQPVGVVSR